MFAHIHQHPIVRILCLAFSLLALSSLTLIDANITNASPQSNTYIVNHASDDNNNSCDPAPGDCTLRDAIEAANAHPGLDYITFDLGTGTPTIHVGAVFPNNGDPLPQITDPVVIDGHTGGATRIELDGSSVSSTDPGLWIYFSAGGSTIKSMVINRFGFGIDVYGDNSSVVGSYIGTDSSGAKASGNKTGVYVWGQGNTVARNIISGNQSYGIEIQGNLNIVQGNYVGTNQSGGALGNYGGVLIHGKNNKVGGTGAGEGNTILYNNVDGISIVSGKGNALQRNKIDSNGSLGIDLGPAGVTPNDAGDADGGVNNLQNFPLVRAANKATGAITIKINTMPNTTMNIDVFSNRNCDGSGHGEGQTFFASKQVTTNGNGVARITFTTSHDLFAEPYITATATDLRGNTSEFSKCRMAQ